MHDIIFQEYTSFLRSAEVASLAAKTQSDTIKLKKELHGGIEGIKWIQGRYGRANN